MLQRQITTKRKLHTSTWKESLSRYFFNFITGQMYVTWS